MDVNASYRVKGHGDEAHAAWRRREHAALQRVAGELNTEVADADR
jgi:hypothetical protein